MRHHPLRRAVDHQFWQALVLACRLIAFGCITLVVLFLVWVVPYLHAKGVL